MELSINCLLLGDNYTGKTSFCQSIKNRADSNKKYIQTIGVDYARGKIMLNGFKYNLNLWELSGSKRFIPVAHTYLNIAKIVLLFFSYNDIQSITNLRIWLDILKDRTNSDYKIYIIGGWVDVKESCDIETKKYIEGLIEHYSHDFHEVISTNYHDVNRVLKLICLNYRILDKKTITKKSLRSCCIDSLTCI